jgi:hypothetical protein
MLLSTARAITNAWQFPPKTLRIFDRTLVLGIEIPQAGLQLEMFRA